MRQLRASVLEYLEEYCDICGLNWRGRVGHYTMESNVGAKPNRFYLLTGRDRASQFRARSFTVAGALIDEATTVREEFANAVADRCRVPDARMVVITNPGGPKHWLKERWDNADWRPFTLRDNLTLSADYIDGLKERYTGANYRRMVEGEWAALEGLIYPHLNIGMPPLLPDGSVDRVRSSVIGFDHAESGVSHGVRIALLASGKRFVDAEWRHDHQAQGALSFKEQARRVVRDLGGANTVFVDPSKTAARMAFKPYISRAYAAENDVSEGLQYTRAMLDNEQLWISPRCEHLIGELHNYVWDEVQQLAGIDKPVKANDHGADALRYGMYSLALRTASKKGVSLGKHR